VSAAPPSLPALNILGLAVVVPNGRLPIEQVFEQERYHVEQQLSALTTPFRARLLEGLGLSSIATFENHRSSDAAEEAARRALSQAELDPASLGLIIDYSTLAVDSPRVWSLAHYLQGRLAASKALAIGTRGSGCAGLHLALLLAQNLLSANSNLEYALLVAADRAPDGGRCCLPVSVMADAASALVVCRAEQTKKRLGRVHAVVVHQQGTLADLLVVAPNPCRMHIDSSAFERKVLPLHFVMLHRLLSRATKHAGIEAKRITACVYPNTTALDRMSIARGFELSETVLVGPGPRHLGHAFANDLVINAEALFSTTEKREPGISAWLAAGSGFTWGAAIIEVNC
jgi:3-oxoacyl-[acyl-carrier-protein] synthase III